MPLKRRRPTPDDWSEELSREEMMQILRDRIRASYHMSLEQFLSARERGEIPDDPEARAIEVFSGAGAGTKQE